MASQIIPFSKIKKIDIINIKGGMTYSQVMSKYKPDILINLALYDVNSKENIVNLVDENKPSGYLFTENGIGIKGDKELIWTTFSKAKTDNSVRDFVAGSPILVQDSKVNIEWGNKYSSYVDGVHKRSAVGFNDNGLILLCTDNNMSLKELANTCVNSFGAKYMINCDGGGSCHLQVGSKIYSKSTRANCSWLLVFLNNGNDDKEVGKMRLNIHAGHNPDGKVACGAIGLIKESTEARKVKDEIIRLLKQEGHTVFDTTIDNGTSSNDVLSKIVGKCNANKVDLDISIHFNSGANDKNGNDTTTGVEVYGYDTKQKSIGDRICSKISGLGYRNRGFKVNPNYYFLRNTNAQALLVECCFVDDKDDINKYNYKTMAKAIVEGILNKTISETQPSKPSNSKMIKIKVDGKVYDMEGVLIDGSNYLKVRELEKAGYKIGFDGSMAIIDKP